ncbi:Initiation-specific alpha-1,6-mannosyltransferase [Colletotrichum fructicola]|nr:Initiation-specific alpha-1,6-mannosyltransferase [Colletotrichum fructicola]
MAVSWSRSLPFALVILLLLALIFHSLTASALWTLTPTSFYRLKSPSGSEPAEQVIDPNTLLPHIPPKIWQVSILPDSIDSQDPIQPPPYASNWLSLHPSFAYTIVNAAGALAAVARLEKLFQSQKNNVNHLSSNWASSVQKRRSRRNIQDDLRPETFKTTQLYTAIAQPVMQADFVRYALLALEGGVYSDSDTYPLRPLRDWVPQEFRNHTQLIVGIEADSQPPVEGTTYPVQFGQWTIAGAKGHPVFLRMLRRILGEVRWRTEGFPTDSIAEQDIQADFTNEDILKVSGPAGWTEEIYEYLSDATETSFTWRNLTGLEHPMLIHDVLVLPIDGFATGVPHSGASMEPSDLTMVKHDFLGSWKHQV